MYIPEVFTVEGAIIYIYYRMCFYFAKKKFCCYLYNSVKVLESPGTLMRKVLECEIFFMEP